jgi:hypothetical protein
MNWAEAPQSGSDSLDGYHAVSAATVILAIAMSATGMLLSERVVTALLCIDFIVGQSLGEVRRFVAMLIFPAIACRTASLL